MDRREIFNILFNGSMVNVPIVPEPDPVLETPAYLRTDQAIPFFKEWTALPAEDNFSPEFSVEYAFTIMLDLNYPAKAPNQENAIVCKQFMLGIKNGHSIQAGINEQGYLFIDKVVDLRAIEKDKLLTGIQLVLAVNPLGTGMSFAKLKIMDRAGLTLSTLKSMQYATTDWAGDIKITDPDFNFLRIEGLKAVHHTDTSYPQYPYKRQDTIEIII
ncbi:hypothetical protein HDE68_000473 [Pedobacter cryoconitis]|uniref:Uncharacterized protein n=1 Tax=Pedobacter cryoconitis TaxID=188932 RepID=A0A7W8ZIT8_9SPHI|nr:hypothetical protein [Pedobacter cryoconitis]MBB5634588.1 hypothetical protein [Pedobacter cryoconitis]